MTNDQFSQASESKSSPFGTRLQSAREALGFERKDVAAQLRLNEKVILMMEKDHYPADLPVTFIRGYLRAYGKLLQIPELEVKAAVESVKPKPQTAPVFLTPMTIDESVGSSNYFMQFLTYLIVITLIALVGMWWYNHSPAPSSITESKLTALEPQTLSMNETVVTPPLLAAPAAPSSTTPAVSQENVKPIPVAVAKPKKVIARKVIVAPEEDDHEENEDFEHTENERRYR